MPLVTKTSQAAMTALIYITAGTLILVWSGVWLAWLLWRPEVSQGTYFLCTGSILTGLALLAIGLLLGQIGRAAKPAEHPAEVASTITRDANGNVVTTGPAAVPQQPVVPQPVTPVVNRPATMQHS